MIPLLMLLLAALVCLVFVGSTLKLVGLVQWSWRVILAPIWVTSVLGVLWLVGWVLFWGVFIGTLSFIAK